MSLLIVNGLDKRIHMAAQHALLDGSMRAHCGALGPWKFAESARWDCDPCPYCIAVDRELQQEIRLDQDWGNE